MMRKCGHCGGSVLDLDGQGARCVMCARAPDYATPRVATAEDLAAVRSGEGHYKVGLSSLDRAILAGKVAEDDLWRTGPLER